jgi:hypothetical protein
MLWRRSDMQKDRWIARWEVASFSDPDKKYIVAVDRNGGFACSCPRWVYKREECKHIKFVKGNGDITIEDLFCKRLDEALEDL